MAIPGELEIVMPLLERVSHGEEYQIRDIIDPLADHFSLTTEERVERYPSGEGRFRKKCRWAEYHMTERGLLESTRRGYHRITEQGLEELRRHAEALANETAEARHGIVEPEQAQDELRENPAVIPNVTEEAIRRIVREEIESAKQELKSVLKEMIDKVG